MGLGEILYHPSYEVPLKMC